MKKYLYLRILAAINMVIAVICMVLLLRFLNSSSNTDAIYSFLIGETIFATLAAHSGFILFIYNKYFPDKEMPRAAVVCYRINEVLGWLAAVFLSLVFVFAMPDLRESEFGIAHMTLVFCGVMAVLMMIQMVQGMRLVETIRENARLTLENSFN